MKKEEIISKIKKIVNEWGGFSIGEVEGAESPLLQKLGKDSEWMVEGVYSDDVSVTKYVHGGEVGEDDVPYENLPKRVLMDILAIAKDYETEQKKTIENGVIH